MSKDIVASKVITITQDVSANSTLTLTSNSIGFIPDECIIKVVSFYGVSLVATSEGLYHIKSNLNNDIISSFTTSIYYDALFTLYSTYSTTTPNVRIMLKNGVNNNITFTLNNITGTSTNGNCCLTVEFLQHKK